MPTEYCVVLTTMPAESDAATLAEQLVTSRLAACVNILPPMTSIYRWQGEVERAQELQVIIKTVSARLPALREALTAHHPYEVPELLVLPVTDGSPAYLAWLREATDGSVIGE